MIKIDTKFLSNNTDLALMLGTWYIDNNIKLESNIDINTFVTVPFIIQIGILTKWLSSRNILINAMGGMIYLTYNQGRPLINVDTNAMDRCIDSVIDSYHIQAEIADDYLTAVNSVIVQYFKRHTLPF